MTTSCNSICFVTQVSRFKLKRRNTRHGKLGTVNPGLQTAMVYPDTEVRHLPGIGEP